MIFLYFLSLILAFLSGLFLSKQKPKIRNVRKQEETVFIKEIENFLNYDGDTQE